MEKQTKIFTITTSPDLMKRIERFLALLHFNSGFGHSGLFGMFLDGDGCEKVEVSDLDRNLRYEVEAIGGVGYHIEIAGSEGYGGRFVDSKRKCVWAVKPSATLYKDDEVHRVIPAKLWKED